MNERPSSAESTGPGTLATAGLWLRGGIGVAADVYRGTVDIVAGVHDAVSETGAAWNPTVAIARPVRGLVYRQVRDIGALSFAIARTGVGLTRAVAPWPARPGPHDVSLGFQSALNGACGDYLAASGNELALTMTCHDASHDALPTGDRPALAARLASARPRLVLLIHGLGMNDRQWRRGQEPDIGDRLAVDRNATTLRLRYNTGRAIADNGRELAVQLEALLAAWPGRLDDIVLVGHSMGGLVAHHAFAQATASGLRWPQRCHAFVCLGSPHRGAPLARLAHATTGALGWTPYTRPFAAIGQARSAGIQDLRGGGVPADARIEAHRPAYLLLAATLGQRRGDVRDRCFGDLLVGIDSATDRRHAGAAPDITARVFARRHHFDLLGDEAVYDVLRQWLDDRPATSAGRRARTK
ncbi:alpha/beta fold hydrolase [Salinisphaera sp. Q1T1-3]|uniref:alpha/beta fold hydrolase n=1 Tax=Salinisphaera sp. Q1T1-3 TaxID=2321229 RepID=UPI000E72F186|nr:alpha/beta fold hydrolase [Salinisphaera sp. Q1T1-3]RJS91960.1 alpha/beta hydrolase [Salinisphaera sp. Q1T1-3]